MWPRDCQVAAFSYHFGGRFLFFVFSIWEVCRRCGGFCGGLTGARCAQGVEY